MTSPSLLLGGASAPGVRYWSTGLDLSYVAGILRRGGAWVVALDAAAGLGVEAFHTEIAAALELPDYYGRNLDALNDCLGDLHAQDRGVPVVLWDDWQGLAAQERRFFETTVDLLGQWVCLVLRTGPSGLTPRAG